MERLKAAGIKVIPVVASVALARRLNRLGADAVIAEERVRRSRGEMTTMCLVPMVVDAVDVPVIAAGVLPMAGVSWPPWLWEPRVQMGTRFICAEAQCTPGLPEE